VDPAATFANVVGEALGGTSVGDVEGERGAADPVRHLRKRFARGRNVDAEDLSALVGQSLGDRLADAASRPGDGGRAPSERPLPVLGHGHRVSGLDVDRLPVDVCRARGQEKAKRRLHRPLAAAGDLHHLRGRSIAADLLRHRPDEALDRPLGRGSADRFGLDGRGRQHDHPAVALERRNRLVEEVIERTQPRRRVDSGRVEDERGGPALLLGCGGGVQRPRTDRAQHLVDGLLQPPALGLPEGHRPRDDGLPRLVAANARRRGQAEPTGSGPSSSAPLHNRRHPHASRGADRDQATPGPALGQELRQCRHDPSTGGAEGMARGEG
jgi:hypothetical protein